VLRGGKTESERSACHDVPVLILLPPSERKAQPEHGRPVDLTKLSFPSLTPERERLLGADLQRAPAVPAGVLYTGVLYAELDLPSLPAVVRRSFVIISAQFGAVRPSDRIPTYKRAIDAARWRPLLDEELPRAAGRGLILDCRSSVYQAAWRPVGRQTQRWVHVQVVREIDGRRTVVSHDAKRTRGEVARFVATSGSKPKRSEDLVALLAQRFRCEIHPPGRPQEPQRLTIIT